MQLNLELPLRESAPRVRRFFRSDKNGLIEDFGDVAFIYGFWDRHFGCWIEDRVAACVVECVPDWEFLNAAGQGQSPKAAANPKRISRPRPLLSTEADVAFFAFFQSVPHHLRRLVHPLGPHQWLALDLINREPEFATFVDGLQAHDQMNFLHACFGLANIVDLRRNIRHSFGNQLRHMSRVALLNRLSGQSDAAGVPWSEGRLRLLYKLTAPLTTSDDICVFLKLTEDEDLLHYASHAKAVSLYGLEAFSILWRHRPFGRRIANFVHAFSQFEDGEYLRDLLQHALAVLSEKGRKRLYSRLSSIACDEDLYLWRYEIEEELDFDMLRAQEFPAPPVPLDRPFAPITNGDDLEREARHMRNCLRSRVLDAVEGQSYFFHWKGQEEATVEVSRTEDGSWSLAEALGRGNRPLSYATRETIENLINGRLDPQEKLYLFDDGSAGAGPALQPAQRKKTSAFSASHGHSACGPTKVKSSVGG